MIVEEVMRREVWTLSPEDLIHDAIELMNAKTIRHIPIIDSNRHVVGIISDRDIRGALSIDSINSRTRHTSIQEMMTEDVITAHPLDFVEEVASLFYENRISCIPIVSDEKLVGIVTETDILYTFLQLTGALQPGSKIEVKVPHRSGMLAKVTAIISEHNVNIQSVLVNPYQQNESYKILVFRVQTMNPTAIVQTLKDRGFDVLLPYTWELQNE
ncbi:acetoin utilization AcuB family protein [Bacillus carboniphilus]|uniref:Acetoin utilization AcuB family protein n=1 Tax=Bacillus carboniphilus TaxID=86663 RepID=A0ABP3G5T2_9BACI